MAKMAHARGGRALRGALRWATACTCFVLSLVAVASADDPLGLPALQFGSGFDSAPDIAGPDGGLSSCITPLPDISVCAGRSWHYAVVEVLAMQRDNQSCDRPLVIDTAGNQTALSTSDLNPGVALGGRAFYGHYGESGWGWEAGYLGVYGMTASQTRTGNEYGLRPRHVPRRRADHELGRPVDLRCHRELHARRHG